MIVALLLIVVLLALAGGAFVHPLLFVLAAVFLVWLLVSWRGARGPPV